jgi:hypothetical protein
MPTGTLKSFGGGRRRRREEAFALGALHERGITLHKHALLILDPWLARASIKLMRFGAERIVQLFFWKTLVARGRGACDGQFWVFLYCEKAVMLQAAETEVMFTAVHVHARYACLNIVIVLVAYGTGSLFLHCGQR